MSNSEDKKQATLIGDGACKGNPGPGGWGFIYVDGQKAIEAGARHSATTNNEMELMAFVEGLKQVLQSNFVGSLNVYWDSKYVLSGASAWMFGWSKNGWKTKVGEPVKNKELWSEAYSLIQNLKKKIELKYFYVPGHSGFPGNERVDEIASSFSEGQQPDLFKGSLKAYAEDYSSGLKDLEEFKISPRTSSKTENKAKAYYLSLVGGKVYRDDSWSQCEARVKGTGGAKYKKIKSEAEEKETLKKWGV